MAGCRNPWPPAWERHRFQWIFIDFDRFQRLRELLSLPSVQVKDWRELPDAPLSLEDDYGPEYKRLMDAHKTLNDCKKAKK